MNNEYENFIRQCNLLFLWQNCCTFITESKGLIVQWIEQKFPKL